MAENITSNPAVDPDLDPASGQRTIVGSSRIDFITGAAEDDVIDGRAGGDVILTGAGNDYIVGGAGNDKIIAGDGTDTLIGGLGSDSINAGGMSDTVLAGDGNDTIFGGGAADTIFGGIGNDTVQGGLGADVLVGGAGSDTLIGNSGADTFVIDTSQRGAGDIDIIDGGVGDDALQIIFADRDEAEAFDLLRLTDGDEAAFASIGLIVSGIEEASTAVVVDFGPVVEAPLDVLLNEDDPDQAIDLLDGVIDLLGGGLTVDDFSFADLAPAGLTLQGNTLEFSGADFQVLSAGQVASFQASFDVVDADGTIALQVATISVEGANDPVTAVNDGAFVTDEVSLLSIATVDLLANDSDVDLSDILSVINVSASSAEGAAVMLLGGTVVYDPGDAFLSLESGQTLTDTFAYTVTDGNGSTDAATVTVVVEGVSGNTAPVVQTIEVVTNEDAGIEVFDLLASPNVSDPDGDELTVSNVGQIGGTFLLSNQGAQVVGSELEFDTNEFNGLSENEQDLSVFGYQVSDGQVAVQNSIEITVEGRNDALAIDLANSDLTVDLLAGLVEPGPAGFIDFEGFAVGTVEPITDGFAIITTEAGNQRINAQGFTQIPGVFEGQFFGFSSTTFRIDFQAGVSAVTFGLFDPNTAGGTIQALDQAGNVLQELVLGDDIPLGPPGGSTSQPVAFFSPNQNIFAIEIDPLGNDLTAIDNVAYGALPVVAGFASIAFSDPDLNDVHDAFLTDARFVGDTSSLPPGFLASDLISAINLVEPGPGGLGFAVVEFLGSNDLFEALGANDLLTIEADIEISDQNGSLATETVSFTIQGLNDQPVTLGDFAATDEETAVLIDVLANDFDPDGDALTVFAVNGQDLSGGPVTLASGATVALDVATGQLLYDPASSLANRALRDGESLVETFFYSIDDGSGAVGAGTVAVTVAGVGVVPTVNLSLNDGFDASISGSLYGLGVDPFGGPIAVVGQNGTTIDIFVEPGVTPVPLPLPGDQGSVGDLFFAPEDFALNGTNVPEGSLLVVSGDIGTPEIFALEPQAGFVIASLAVPTPSLRTVGADFNAATGTIFLLSDTSDTIFEIDPADGSQISSIDLGLFGFTVGNGDIAIDPTTGDLFVVSDLEDQIIHLSPVGEELTRFQIPAGVDGITGLAVISGSAIEFVASSLNGDVSFIGEPPANLNTAPQVSNITVSVTEDDGFIEIPLADEPAAFDPDDDPLTASNLVQVDGLQVDAFLVDNLLDLDLEQFNELSEGDFETVTFTYDVSDGINAPVQNTVTVEVTGINDPVDLDDLANFDPVSESEAFFALNIGDFIIDPDLNDGFSLDDVLQIAGRDVALGIEGLTLVFPIDGFFDDLSEGETEELIFEVTVSDGFSSTTRELTVNIEGENNPVQAVDDGSALNVGVQIVSPQIGGQLGQAATAIGDVNSDGIDDILISAPSVDANGATRSGESYVIFGDDAGLPETFDVATLDGTNGFALNGFGEYAYGGTVLAGVGDFNGDDIDDFAIGLPNGGEDDGGAATYAGEVYIVFGSNEGFDDLIDLETLSGDAGLVIGGINSFDNAGAAVSAIGDINNDGSVDLAIGAPGGEDGAGETYVLFGGAARSGPVSLFGLDGTNGFVATGPSGGASGRVISDAVDLNGDGIDDLVIGTPGIQENDPGTVHVVFGSDAPFGATVDLGQLDGTNGFELIATGSEDEVGAQAISSAGDINNDGFEDLIIGNFAADPGRGPGPGEAFVVFGTEQPFDATVSLDDLDGTNGFRIGGLQQGDELGFSVDGVGDVNGDGIDDVLIGAPSAAPDGPASGQSFLVFGDGNGFVTDFDLSTLNGTNGFILNGAGLNSGIAVSAAGDVNGDGIQDLMVGQNLASDGQGGVTVVFGGETLSVLDRNRDGVIELSDVGGSLFADLTIAEDNVLNILVETLLANDIDPDRSDELTLTDVSATSTAGGLVTLQSGEISYDPNGQFNDLADGETASDTFTYIVEDGNGGISTGTVTVRITGVTGNSPPVVSTVFATTNEDAEVQNFDLLPSVEVFDPDGDGLFTSNLSQIGGALTLGPTDFSLVEDTLQFDTGVYDALGVGESDTAIFTYDVSDGINPPVQNTIEVVIEGRNDAPVFANIGAIAPDPEDQVSASIALDQDIFDPDVNDQITILNVTQTDGISVEVDLVGNVATYFISGAFEELSEGEVETITFTFDVTDGTQTLSRTAMREIVGVNDDPNAINDALTIDEGASVQINVLGNDEDVDRNDELSVSAVDAVSVQGAAVSIEEGGIRYNAGSIFDGLNDGETATDTFTYTVSDGNGGEDTATVTITISGLGQALIGVDDDVTTDEDTPLILSEFDLLSNDQGEGLRIDAIDAVSELGVSILVDQFGITYDPTGQFDALADGEQADDSFTYTVADDNGQTQDVTVNVTIFGVNDPAQDNRANGGVLPDLLEPLGQANVFFNLLDGFVDPEGGELSGSFLSITSTNFDRTFDVGAFDADGILDIEAASFLDIIAGARETITITFEVFDDAGDSIVAQSSFDLVGVNEAPSVDSASVEANEDDPVFTFDLTSLAFDEDGDELTAIELAQAGGRIVDAVIQNGTDLTFNPALFNDLAEGETETLSFFFDIDDGTVTVGSVIDIVVTGANDAPQITVDPLTVTVQEDVGPLSLDLSTNVSDPDGDELFFDTDAFGAPTMLFFEDFSDEVAALGGGSGAILAQNFTGFDQFNVTAGSVDIANNFNGGVGPEIDLDGTFPVGTTDPAGQLETIQSFTFRAGHEYELTFGHRPDDAIQVTIGDVLSETIEGAGDNNLRTETFTFTVPTEQTATIVFTQLGLNDNNGAFLSDIQLTERALADLDSAGNLSFDPALFLEDLAAGETETLTFDYTVSDGIADTSGQVEITVEGVAAPLTANADQPGENRFGGLVLAGNTTGDQAGFSVSELGDVNGDGITDLIVSSPFSSDASVAGGGFSNVIFGDGSLDQISEITLNSTFLDGTGGFQIIGLYDLAYSGTTVSSAGDVNGDGVDDILISARDSNYAETATSFVVFGASDLGQTGTVELDRFNFLDGVRGFEIVADNAINVEDLNQVHNVGDLNGDGIDDIGLSFQLADFPVGESGRNTGTVYVVFGSTDTVDGGLFNLSDIDGETGFFIQAPDGPYSDFGLSLTGGDINGDGIDDLIVGDRSASTGVYSSGGVFVIFGAEGLTSNAPDGEIELGNFDFANLDGTLGFAITPTQGDQSLGQSVSAVGDINGDGVADVVISTGFGYAPYGGSGAEGRAYVVFGDQGLGAGGTFDLDAEIESVVTFSSSANIDLGDVDIVGDVNGDGIDDFLIGAQYNGEAGMIYLVFGADDLEGRSIDLDALDGTTGYRFEDVAGPDPIVHHKLSGAGDLNDDGFADLVFGAPEFTAGRSELVGQSVVIYGDTNRFAQLDLLDGEADGLIAIENATSFTFGDLVTTEDRALSFAASDLLRNDVDGDGNPITITAVDAVSATDVAVAFDGTTITYDPTPAFQALGAGEVAEDTFTYTITAGGQTATATVTVRIVGLNDVPSAPATLALQTHMIGVDDVVGPAPGDVVDPDTGDALLFSATLRGGEPLPAFLADNFSTTDGSITLDAQTGNGNEGLFRIETSIDDQNGQVLSLPYYLAIHDLENVGTAGDDILITADSGQAGDLFFSGAGNDLLRGGDGSDVYVYRTGDGLDFVSDGGFADQDAILFEQAALTDVTFTRFLETSEDLLAGIGGETALLVQGGLGVSASLRIEEYNFADGARLDDADIRAGVNAAATTGGADRILGFTAPEGDTLEGGAGNDVVRGLDGSDLYLYTLGDGDDIIDDNGFGDTDRLEIRGVDLSNAVFTRVGLDLDDVLITMPDGGSIRIVGGLETTAADQIEEIVFVDSGDTIGSAELRDFILRNTQPNGAVPDNAVEDETLIGFSTDDTLNGLRGDDLVSGRDGSDTYLYSSLSPADGDLIIDDRGFFDTDVLEIQGSRASFTFERGFNSNDLLVNFVGGAPPQEIRIVDQLEGSATGQIEEIVFTLTGNTLTADDVREELIVNDQAAGLTTITGFGATADTLTASDTALVLTGQDGSDTYIVDSFNVGDVTISDQGFSGVDVLDIVGIDDTVRYFRSEGDLDDLFIDTNNQIIRIVDGLEGNPNNTIEAIVEGDVTITSMDQVRERLIQDQIDFGDARIIATTLADTVILGVGDNYVDLRGGADQLTIFADTGNKTIDTDLNFSGDTLTFGGATSGDVDAIRGSQFATRSVVFEVAGSDITLINGREAQAFETVVFDDTTLDATEFQAAIDADIALPPLQAGTADNDVLEPTADTSLTVALQGGGGGDTYVINTDASLDRLAPARVEIFDDAFSSGDRVVLRGGSIEDYEFRILASDLDGISDIRELDEGDLLITTPTGEIVIHQTLQGSTGLIEIFEFTGDETGPSVELSLADIRADLVAGQATAGSDTIIGFDGDDTLSANFDGLDVLRGFSGNDRYVIEEGSAGFDNRVIIQDLAGGGTDLVEFQGVVSTQVTFSRVLADADDLLITDPFEREIVVTDTLSSNFQGGIEQFQFADGVIDTQAVRDIILNAEVTEGDDTIIGFAVGDTLTSAGGGDDVLSGGAGGDLYILDLDTIQDVLIDDQGAAGVDTVRFINGVNNTLSSIARDPVRTDDLILTFASGATVTIRNTLADNFDGGITSVEFVEAGVTQTMADFRANLLAQAVTEEGGVIIGFTTDDTLSGGPGNDVLQGGAGSDLYDFAIGHGQDIVNDGFGAEIDTIRTEYNSSELEVRATGADRLDLQLNFIDSDDSITVTNGLIVSGVGTIEQFILADVILTLDEVRQLALDGQATGGDDTIVGYGGNDTLTGGAGSDLLTGGQGNDVFVFNVGDGADIIDDQANANSTADRLILNGFDLADVTLSRFNVGLDHLQIDTDGLDSLLVVNAFGSGGGVIETYEFDDVTLTRDELQALI